MINNQIYINYSFIIKNVSTPYSENFCSRNQFYRYCLSVLSKLALIPQSNLILPPGKNFHLAYHLRHLDSKCDYKWGLFNKNPASKFFCVISVLFAKTVACLFLWWIGLSSFLQSSKELKILTLKDFCTDRNKR